jgi:Asp-tRNA(Asn)/Glu-tRNA(Gln) amidotransferase A subunit family amidase
VILGKTHTTEFAYFDPSPARNPHNIVHTPGGSSSGSAAAVGAGAVPLAVGTQTVVSVNRPAAYCGVAAFKPSTAALAVDEIVEVLDAQRRPLDVRLDTARDQGRKDLGRDLGSGPIKVLAERRIG